MSLPAEIRSATNPVYSSLWGLLGWSVLGAASFMAPYVYLYYAGAGAFPPLAWTLLTLIVVLFAANALRAIRRKVSEARVEAVT